MSTDKKAGDPRRDQLLIFLRDGHTLKDAAAAIGVSHRQVRRWRADDPELEEAVQEAMWAVDDEVEAVTYQNCLDPDPAHNTLRMFWLKSRRPEVYRETIKQEHTATVAVTASVREEAEGKIDEWRREQAAKLSSMLRP